MKIVIDVPLGHPITVAGKKLSVMRLSIRNLKRREQRKVRACAGIIDQMVLTLAYFSGLPVAVVEQLTADDIESINEAVTRAALPRLGGAWPS